MIKSMIFFWVAAIENEHNMGRNKIWTHRYAISCLSQALFVATIPR